MATSSSKKAARRRANRKKKMNNLPWVIAAAVIVVLLATPRIWTEIKVQTNTGDFAQLIREGRSSLNQAQESYPDLGRAHVAFGTEVTYNSSPPTSGPHYGRWVQPGFYRVQQEDRELVHSLEHGNVVAYYGDVNDEVLDTLDDWTLRFQGNWDGMIATPLSDIGEGVILTAWRHVLRLDPFDPALAAAFIDRHRGRGPENPVR